MTCVPPWTPRAPEATSAVIIAALERITLDPETAKRAFRAAQAITDGLQLSGAHPLLERILVALSQGSAQPLERIPSGVWDALTELRSNIPECQVSWIDASPERSGKSLKSRVPELQRCGQFLIGTPARCVALDLWRAEHDFMLTLSGTPVISGHSSDFEADERLYASLRTWLRPRWTRATLHLSVDHVETRYDLAAVASVLGGILQEPEWAEKLAAGIDINPVLRVQGHVSWSVHPQEEPPVTSAT